MWLPKKIGTTTQGRPYKSDKQTTYEHPIEFPQFKHL